MKRKHRMIFVLAIAVLLTLAFSTTAFAISESDVQAQVDASSRETVSGNVFIWFLCAIAFLKVSQKIDSFMSSLGINVGHTGGSMLAEAMIATRGITDGKKLFGGGGFAGFGGRGSRSASGTSGASGADGASGGFMSGGLAGVVSRNINRSAAQTATGQGGGIVGGTAFNSSLEKGGDFANNVIGSVAKGSVSSTGTMKGEQAVPIWAMAFRAVSRGLRDFWPLLHRASLPRLPHRALHLCLPPRTFRANRFLLVFHPNPLHRVCHPNSRRVFLRRVSRPNLRICLLRLRPSPAWKLAAAVSRVRRQPQKIWAGFNSACTIPISIWRRKANTPS